MDDRGRADLLEFLAAQRPSALAVVAGLDETAMMRPVVPSGWAPRGMLEHLAGAERYWFQRVLTGRMHVSACEGDGVQGQAVHEETDDGVLRSPSPERRHRRPRQNAKPQASYQSLFQDQVRPIKHEEQHVAGLGLAEGTVSRCASS